MKTLPFFYNNILDVDFSKINKITHTQFIIERILEYSSKDRLKKNKRLLEILGNAEILKDFYLAGGTGLAFKLKHSLSIDLDFLLEKISIKNPYTKNQRTW